MSVYVVSVCAHVCDRAWVWGLLKLAAVESSGEGGGLPGGFRAPGALLSARAWAGLWCPLAMRGPSGASLLLLGWARSCHRDVWPQVFSALFLQVLFVFLHEFS